MNYEKAIALKDSKVLLKDSKVLLLEQHDEHELTAMCCLHKCRKFVSPYEMWKTIKNHA